MVDVIYIFLIIEDSLYSSIFLVNFIHLCLILFNPRFHHHTNMFILNICVSFLLNAIYFTNYLTMLYFDLGRLFVLQTCNFLFYSYNIASVMTPLSFVNFTIHRYCSIVHYTKPFFKRKRWVVICIVSQFIAELIIASPYLLRIQPVSIAKKNLCSDKIQEVHSIIYKR
jgi:hypothetical protein